MLVRRLALAAGAGSLAHAVQVFSFALGGVFLPPAFLLSHWLVVVGVHLAAALLLGGLRDHRVWGAAALIFPVAVSVANVPAVAETVGPIGVTIAALVFVAIWSSAFFGPAAILVEATAGAVVAVVVARLRLDVFAGGSTGDVTQALLLVAVAGAAMLVALLVRWRRRDPSLPGPALGVAVATGALVLSAGSVLGVRSPADGVPPAAAAKASDPPAVLIVLDTLRASQLRIYGNERDTMPRLERWAREESAVARRSVANGGWTLPSHASMFTGLYPPRHGAHRYFEGEAAVHGAFGYGLSEEIPTLSALLSDDGYLTMGLSSNFGPLGPAFGLHRGFDAYSAVPSPRHDVMHKSPWIPGGVSHDGLRSFFSFLQRVPPFSSSEIFLGPPYRRASEISDAAIEMVDRAGDRPFFLFVNYLDPHTPYDPPAAFQPDAELLEAGRRSVGDEEAFFDAIVSGKRKITELERDYMLALYDGELAYLDQELDRLLQHLKQHPRWDEMLVIVTSDHGDAFGEHGVLRHNVTLHDSLTWVPLFIKPGASTPGAPAAGSEISHPVQSVDLFATVLAHAGASAPDDVDGLPWGTGREDAMAWRYIFPRVANLDPERFSTIHSSIERGRWKLIRTSSERVELYDMVEDPAESRDVSDQGEDVIRSLMGPLIEASAAERRSEGGMEELSAETLEALRALGYVDDAGEAQP